MNNYAIQNRQVLPERGNGSGAMSILESPTPFRSEGVCPGCLADFPTNLVRVVAHTVSALVVFVRRFINVILV